ncbi:hypothetical protein ACFQVC_04605 [Streptomyces monticola]|uniref:MFS transporter n=1 Tax=Streptomyces monticola TaxID=2666263 RepID=A0ABW2JDN8_9ACTN
MGARHAPQHGGEREGRRGGRPGRPDISLAQLAGAGLGAAAGMTLASELHLYGTVTGAVVFAVAATVGGPLIQHALQRLGEGCGALVRTARGRVAARGGAPGAARGGALGAVVPLAAIGVLAFGTVAATGSAAPAAAPQDHKSAPDQAPSREPVEKVTQTRADSRKTTPRRMAPTDGGC